MSRSAHTYALDGAEVVLTVPEGVRVPRVLGLKRTADGADAVFEHVGVRAVKSKPRRPVERVKKRATPVPDPFEVTEAMRAWAAEKAPSLDVDRATEQFVNHWKGTGRLMVDWVATWRNGMDKQHGWNVERGWKPKAKAVPVDESPRDRWCREHGVTVEEYEQRKGDAEWLERIKRRGVVA